MVEKKEDVIEKIKKEIPKEWDIEIDVEEYFEDRKPFISFELLDSENESAIEYIKETLVDKGYKEEDVERALEDVDIKFNYHLVFPDKTLKINWESIGAWRGHYTVDVPDINSKDAEKVVNTDKPIKISLVYVLRNPEENEAYLKTAIEELKKAGFDARPVLFATSNPFAVNVDLIVVPSKEKKKLSKKDLQFLKNFSNIYVDKYTSSFSILEGTTEPIDKHLKEFVKEVGNLRKKMEEIL